MTTYNKTTLKTFFEQGDTPTGTNYADLIDSQVNIVETAIQTMAGPLYVTELVTPKVSANNVNFTGTVSAATLIVGDFTFTGNVAGSLSNKVFAISMLTGSDLNTIQANGAIIQSQINLELLQWREAGLRVTTDISANAGTVYASAVRSTNGVYNGTGIVSAAGTTQGTAAVLSNAINRGKGVVDGSTTGYAPPANNAGLVQYLYNEGVSANLWPPTGGTINGLAANAPYSLAASAAYTIFHLTASSMAVHG